MPAFFASMSSASLPLLRAMMDPATPHTYDEILSRIDSNQVALVTGEEDNTPGPGGGIVTNGAGMNDVSSVSRGEERLYETPTLTAGLYTFTMTHDPADAGGDADLYVRVGQRPTTSAYNCRPFKAGSDEACEIQLATPAQLFVMVRGYADRTSHFRLAGQR